MSESPEKEFGPGPNMEVIGNVPDEEKCKIERERRQRLHVHDLEHIPEEGRKKLNQLEYPKTEKEQFLIAHANDYTSRLLERAGMPIYDIPEKNIHIVPRDLYKELAGDSGSSGTSHAREQAISLDASKVRRSNISFGAKSFHEILHLKGFLVLEARNDAERGDFYNTSFRQGLSVYDTEKSAEEFGEYEYFRGLQEAIVALAEKKYICELMELPEMEAEKKHLNSPEITKKRKEIAQGEGISESDIVWVEKDGSFNSIGYCNQRRALDFILEEIKEEFPERFQSTDEVYEKFLNAHLNGDLRMIARLVNKTFGENAFRVLGIMGTDQDSPVLVARTLQTMRISKEGKENNEKEEKKEK